MHEMNFLQSSLVRYTHTARNGSSSGHLDLRDLHDLDSSHLQGPLQIDV